MDTTQPRHINSFGRRRGRPLRANRDALMGALLPTLLIELQGDGQAGVQVDRLLTPEHLFTRTPAPLWFEVGFGGGEHLVEQARRHPEANFIGCEPYVNGMASLLARIDDAKLTNIRLYDGDARLVLERLPDASITRLFVLFPDPWPKARHHKRRIVSQGGLALFHRKLIPGGTLRLATDHADYAAWMAEHLAAFKGFAWPQHRPDDWKNPPHDWVRTRYQAKAEAEGRGAVFLDCIKSP